MALGNSTMTYDQLGQLTAHLLHKAFIETTRTVSKGVFRRLVDGEVVPITQLEFEGDETVQLNMKLHMSAYRGDINYTRFRDGVVALLQELLTALSKEGALKTFHGKRCRRCCNQYTPFRRVGTHATWGRHQRPHGRNDALAE